MKWLAVSLLKEGPGVPKDAPRKTGLALFCAIVGREWWELIKLNLLVILFSLPLVTLPAAHLAATRICISMVEDRNHYLLRDFWEAFCERFWLASLAGATLAIAFLIAAFGLLFYARACLEHLAFALPLAVTLAVVLIIPLYGMHLFTHLAVDSPPLRQLLRPAAIGLLARPLPAFAGLGSVAALWLAHVLFYPASVLMPVLVNFSLGTLAMTFAVHRTCAWAMALPKPVGRSARAHNRRCQRAPYQEAHDMSDRWLHRSLALAVTGLALLQADGRSGAAMAQSAEPVTLKWVLWDWDAVTFYEPLIEAYTQRNPDVKFDYVDLGSADYQTMLQTQLIGGADDLDIVTVKDVPGYTNLAQAGLLLELGAFIKERQIDPAPYGGLIEALTIDDQIFAMPFSSNFWLTYYNKDLFDAAGVDYPTNDMTLEEFDALARSMTTGFGANKVNGTLFHTWRSTVQLPCILDGRHAIVDGDYGFLKPCYERALALQEEDVVPSYASLKTSSTHYSAPFYNNKVAMLPMGSWFIATQIDKVKSGESKSTNWGLVKFPHPDGVKAGTTAAQITGIGVNARSAHQDQALDFIEFVSGPEGAAIMAATGTIPAFRTDKITDTIASIDGFPKDEASREALETEATFLEMPVHADAPEIEVILNRAHDAIMTDNITIDEGIEEMNSGVQTLD